MGIVLRTTSLVAFLLVVFGGALPTPAAAACEDQSPGSDPNAHCYCKSGTVATPMDVEICRCGYLFDYDDGVDTVSYCTVNNGDCPGVREALGLPPDLYVPFGPHVLTWCTRGPYEGCAPPPAQTTIALCDLP